MKNKNYYIGNYSIDVTDEIADKAMKNGLELIHFNDDKSHRPLYMPDVNGEDGYECPTAEEISEWLRREYNIRISVSGRLNGDYEYYGYAYIKDRPECGKSNYGNNYEKVLLGIINKAFDLI